jgi:nucleoid-associated protein YgaU
MTSDAKIGLLLGLVFIFIIAFVINGLPSFRGEKNGNELTHNMAISQNREPAIGARQRDYIAKTRRMEIAPPAAGQVATPQSDAVRHEMQMPTMPAVGSSVSSQVPSPANTGAQSPEGPAQPAMSQVSELPQVHIVAPGENLTSIAKRYYGPVEGNKLSTISRIFRANRERLKSPDSIYEGQKLIIPPREDSSTAAGGAVESLPRTLFEKVKSIGQRRGATEPRATTTREYVVQEGDSLWKIAARNLGDGSRYTEIVRLNAGALDSEDNLWVGTRLKLPTR